MSTTEEQSFCRVCAHGCPIIVTTADGEVVNVRGDRSNDLYGGYTCVKGRAQPAFLRHPDRICHPLRRARDGTFTATTVDHALDEISEKVSAVLAAHGPRAVAGYYGTMASTDSTVSPVMSAFMNAIGSPMTFTANTIDKPGKYIARALHGDWMAPLQGYDDPDVALVIGMNPLITYQGMPMGHPRWLSGALERGMALIVLDPRETDFARRATLHLQLRPGTDALVLAAMLSVILSEGRHDAAFVKRHADGLPALARALEPFRPGDVAGTAGVSEAAIVEAGRRFAGASRAYAIAGTGPNMSGPGTLVEYLVLDLLTVTGRWLRAGERVRNPGCLVARPQPKAQVGPRRPAYGFGERLRVRGLSNTAAGMPTAALPDEILLEGDGQVRVLISCGGNPVSAWPDQRKALEALRSLDLLVQIDPWMSQTSRIAHYVIPPRLPLESPDVTLIPDFGLAPHLGTTDSWAQYTPSIVEPRTGSDVIPAWEFFFGLARRMGLSLTMDTQAIFPIPPVTITPDSSITTDELIELLTSSGRITLDDVKRHPGGARFDEPAVHVAPADPDDAATFELAHPDMLAELDRLQADRLHGLDPREPFPFRLVCRRTTKAYNSSCIDTTTHRGRLHNPAFLHPDDLAGLGLVEGDRALIESEEGQLVAIVAPDPSLRRGLVSLSHGYGDIDLDVDRLESVGVNVNRLLQMDGTYDRFSGQPLMSNVPIRVSRTT